jgi:Flp pilus assembly protein TadG
MNTSRPTNDRGQILVLFALALVAIIAMVGLVLDGGGTFAMKRTQQNAADVAALAAANDLIANQGSADWRTTARTIATENGFTNGVDGASVTVSCVNCPGSGADQTSDAAVDGVQVTVGITAPHENSFAGVMGMPTWDVSSTATSKTGWANKANAPGPFIVSIDAFDAGGDPLHCTGSDDVCDLDHPSDDTPVAWTEFTWTDFGYDRTEYPCPPDGEPFELGNVNNSDLSTYMDGRADFEVTLEFGCYIAQHNDGVMDDIVQDLEDMAPATFPVPIVDEQGKYVGWASFVMTSAVPNGRNGVISGYFETGRIQAQLDVSGAGFGSSTFGSAYIVQLVN